MRVDIVYKGGEDIYLIFIKRCGKASESINAIMIVKTLHQNPSVLVRYEMESVADFFLEFIPYIVKPAAENRIFSVRVDRADTRKNADEEYKCGE